MLLSFCLGNYIADNFRAEIRMLLVQPVISSVGKGIS